MKNAPKYLRAHRNWHPDDFAYLAGKGYTAREIKAIWDRPQQTAPQGRPVIFDAVAYFNR